MVQEHDNIFSAQHVILPNGSLELMVQEHDNISNVYLLTMISVRKHFTNTSKSSAKQT